MQQAGSVVCVLRRCAIGFCGLHCLHLLARAEITAVSVVSSSLSYRGTWTWTVGARVLFSAGGQPCLCVGNSNTSISQLIERTLF